MPTTTNFGWTTPADTDLVSQGAAAMRTLGSGIDTSLVKLKGGTAGQVLSKASGTDLDYSWVSNGWEQIATASLTGTTVSFSSISQAYTDLRVVITTATTSGASNITLRFGTASIDTGTNYQANYCVMGTAAWTAGTAATSLTGTGLTSASYTLCVWEIPEYSRTNTGKHIRGLANGTGTVGSVVEGKWQGTQIAYLNLISSTNFTAGTVYLYGRK